MRPPRKRGKETQMKASTMNQTVTEALVKAVAEAAFDRHPNVGTWVIAYYRRVALILEHFECAGVRINPRIWVLARVLADTGTDPALVLDAWKLASGEGEALEKEIYATLEAWME